MSTKDKVVKILEENTEEYISGSLIANEIGVTRNAVWKAIVSLEKEGYKIEAVTGKGYRLGNENDVVSEAGIAKYLCDDAGPIMVLDTVTSTNDMLREEAYRGAAEGFMLVATEQTKGRGRRGRDFYSPSDTGIYFSFLLRPDMDRKDAGHITTTAAVAVAKALEEYGDLEPGIKWVNDVYLAERKVSGILAEATYSLETDSVDFVIVGIGLNIYDPEGGFPEEIAQKAGSILGDRRVCDARNKLVAFTYKHFFEMYREGDYGKVAEEYKKRCFILGRSITVIRGGEEVPALAQDLTEECGLVVRYADGTEETLTSGEISLRI